MLSSSNKVARAFVYQAHRYPPTLTKSAKSSSSSNSPSESSMQGKDQVQAEKQAKDPKKMANLGEKRAEQERDSAANSTPGVKGKGRDNEPLGGVVKNKAIG